MVDQTRRESQIITRVSNPQANNTYGSSDEALLIFRIAAAAILFISAMPLFAADRWYLLVPARSEYDERSPLSQGYRILDKKPLVEWALQGAYDTASECEGVRNKTLKLQQGILARSSEAFLNDTAGNSDPEFLKAQRALMEAQYANVSAFTASRCVGNDDPRLRP